jgi:protein-S-isoprenylcysteine O-methyltransferase Ste14
MKPWLVVRYFARELLGVIIVGAALFWPARTFNWWEAWACLAVTLAWTIGTAVVIFINNPDLIAERLGPRPGAKGWDTLIMSLLGIAQLARYILAGFDFSHGWTQRFPLGIILLALVVFAAGYALFVWAISVNAYFSQIVRLQPERNQAVVSGGPYRFIRHPGYLGAILVEVGVPILLNSWAAASISLFTVPLLIYRTFLEDQALQKELPGYTAYSQQTQFRLIPRIW